MSNPYIEAGGDPARYQLYSAIAEQVHGITAGGGRVLATINKDHKPYGALGDLTGGVEAIRAGEAWLAEQGCTKVRGPLELATWFPYRANLGPHDEPPFLMEPTAAPEPWVEAGYQEVAHYTSAIISNADAIAYGDSKKPDGFNIRQMTKVGKTLKTLYKLSNEGFVDAFAYSPLSFEAFTALYTPLLDYVVPKMVLIAEWNNVPVGFIFGLPDHQNPDSKRFIAKSMAVEKSVQGAGLGAHLIGELHRVADGMGFTEGIHALMWSGSHSTNFTKDERGRTIRQYVLYEREL